MKDLNKIAFEFYDLDHDGALSVLDLIKLKTAFEDNSAIGKEITKLMEIYQN
jgi:Ca2+-binding EF-hand superfamily protein